MGVMRILSHKGDEVITWKTPEAGIEDVEAQAAVEEAERIFRQQRARGSTAVKVEPGQPAQRIDEFDPNAREIVMLPRVVGG